MADRMYFVGVTTGQSRIVDLFPRWAEALGIEAEIVGRDIPVKAPGVEYREAMAQILSDPAARGGLITTHKVAIFRYASDLFSAFDPWAQRCGEVSCFVRSGDRLGGWALDPVTVWKSLVDIVGPTYFADQPEAEVLCLGAGGSGTAFTARLLTAYPPPARIMVTNRAPERLDILKEIHESMRLTTEVSYHQVSSSEDSDKLLESLAPGSVVANATGMGKDRPGSPITDRARFPTRGIVWDFNYRGSLEFLHQARRQAPTAMLRVEDGWRYFLYGWAEHMAKVFDLEISPDQFSSLAEMAEPLRSAS